MLWKFLVLRKEIPNLCNLPVVIELWLFLNLPLSLPWAAKEVQQGGSCTVPSWL